MFYFILGVLAWQLVVTILIELISEAEKVAVIGGGIPRTILFFLYIGVRNVFRWYINKNYQPFAVVGDSGLTITHVRIKPKDTTNFYQQGESNVYIRPCDWNAYNCSSVNRIEKNGWFNQKWFDSNVRKGI